jgi:hypothetical protein
MAVIVRRPAMPRQVLHIAMGAIYHPSDGNDWLMSNHIIECLDRILQQHPYSGIVLLGDFNRLNDKVIFNYPLTHVVSGSTRCKATPDKIFTNIPEWFHPAEIIPNVAASDHPAVIMSPKQFKSESCNC